MSIRPDSLLSSPEMFYIYPAIDLKEDTNYHGVAMLHNDNSKHDWVYTTLHKRVSLFQP